MKIVLDVRKDAAGYAAFQKLPGLQIVDIDSPVSEDGPREVPMDQIADADAMFCSYPPLNHIEMRKLRWIHIASTGYDQLLGQGLPARGIRASNCRGCFDVPIAEWNIAMMVNLVRNVRQMIRNQDGAVWDRAAMFQREIRGLTVGIWGYGGIGRETARLARQMGMKVHVFARKGVKSRLEAFTLPGTGDPEGVLPHQVFTAGQELEFLRDLDFLVLSMPLTASTKSLIGERELKALPRTAYVLNPARGPIIEEAALIRALQEKWIAGAALDTHYHYPMPPEHPLWRFPDVILTPHISGSSLSQHYLERLWAGFNENAARFASNRPLLNELSAAELSA